MNNITVDGDTGTLIVTDNWPESKCVDNSYFLGSWCFSSMGEERKARSAGRIFEYHWNDREKLKLDFNYLQLLNEDLLDELYITLNQLHCVNEDKRFWRLLIGYWLNLYTAVIFDRWSSLRQVGQGGRSWNAQVPSIDEEFLAADDTSQFVTLATESSKWNHYVFALLINFVQGINCCRLESNSKIDMVAVQLPDIDHFAKRIIKSSIGRYIQSWLKRSDDYFFISPYLPKASLVKLELMLGQFPMPTLKTKNLIACKYDQEWRQWILPTDSCKDEFGVIARQLLPKFLPRIFLESFQELMLAVGKLPWPKSPKVIFTSNAHFSDDVFKAWASRNIALGSRLVIGEHGGFGPGLFNGCHSYELSIADVYLSTGWRNRSHGNIKPIGFFRPRLKNVKMNHSGKALLACGIMPRFSHDIRAMMLSSQVLDYFDDQFCFINALPRNIQNQILVRLPPQDYGWEQKERWLDRHPNVEFDNLCQSMLDTAAQCRLFIGTYMATTYIESLVSNIPTVFFWNPMHWDAKPEAQPFFDRLRDVGIFHESANEAALHISKIWVDISSWWQSDEVQSARKYFCDRYAATPPDIHKRLKEILIAEASFSKTRASR
jgi:putative transferase (TIGR04331 family)